jgi:hypothetical protein
MNDSEVLDDVEISVDLSYKETRTIAYCLLRVYKDDPEMRPAIRLVRTKVADSIRRMLDNV